MHITTLSALSDKPSEIMSHSVVREENCVEDLFIIIGVVSSAYIVAIGQTTVNR